MSDTLSPPSPARSAWDRARLALLVLAGVSVSLPMAWISLAKVLVILVGTGMWCAQALRRQGRPDTAWWTPKVVLVALAAFALSGLWTGADAAAAFNTYVKHAKLLEVVLLVVLIRHVADARVAVKALVAGQVFLLLSSWALRLGLPVPWQAASATANVVFSTYLDQSIMFATTASLLWYLRKERLWPAWLGALLALLALANSLLVLEGRSGYLVALSAIALAAMWAMPAKWRLPTLIGTPVIALAALALGSAQVQERVTKIFAESQHFAQTQQVGELDSSGWRLNAWKRSVQAFAQKPLIGHGVGNWTPAVKQFEGANAVAMFGEGNASNPHQEFLLWAVELGAGGLVLLLGFLASLCRDALRFEAPVGRALLAAVAATAIACMFNSSLYDDLMGDYLVVTLGVLLALGVRQRQLVATP
ncbi:MAG: O-antigen ligase family protein [Rhodoferax sp.]